LRETKASKRGNSYRTIPIAMKKELPKRSIIEVSPYHDELEETNLSVLRLYLEFGYEFHDGDLNYFGALCLRNAEKLDAKQREFFETKCKEDGKVRGPSRLLYYKSKIENGHVLSEEESDDMTVLFKLDLEDSLNKLIESIKKSGENNIKKAYAENAEQITKIYEEARKFDTKTLLVGDKPVFWNKERLLHIITRHIQETFLKYHNKKETEPKTMIPYSINELQELIERVLEKVNKEIQEFFKSGRNVFTRKGIKFNGDSYRIRVDKSGLLMMFTKEDESL
jgi:vacuolar-type H+-ATPase subunit H